MGMRLPQATEQTHAPRNTSRASATTTRLCPADQHARPHVSNYLPAAGGHAPPSPASSPAAATYGARAGRAPLADRELGLSPTQWSPPSTSTCQPSTQGPCQLGCAQQPAKKLLLGHPALDLGPRSAAKIRHPAQIATADSVDLHQTHQASCSTSYCNSTMRRDAEGSPAPVRASPAPVQPQKPKTVSGGRSRPAGRRAWRGQRSGTHPKSPPIEARTEISSPLAPTTTTTPSQPSAKTRGRWRKPSKAPASSAQGAEQRKRVCVVGDAPARCRR